MLNSFCRAHGLAVIADEVFLDYRLDANADASNGVGTSNGHVGTAALGRPVERSSTAVDANEHKVPFGKSGRLSRPLVGARLETVLLRGIRKC